MHVKNPLKLAKESRWTIGVDGKPTTREHARAAIKLGVKRLSLHSPDGGLAHLHRKGDGWALRMAFDVIRKTNAGAYVKSKNGGERWVSNAELQKGGGARAQKFQDQGGSPERKKKDVASYLADIRQQHRNGELSGEQVERAVRGLAGSFDKKELKELASSFGINTRTFAGENDILKAIGQEMASAQTSKFGKPRWEGRIPNRMPEYSQHNTTDHDHGTAQHASKYLLDLKRKAVHEGMTKDEIKAAVGSMAKVIKSKKVWKDIAKRTGVQETMGEAYGLPSLIAGRNDIDTRKAIAQEIWSDVKRRRHA